LSRVAGKATAAINPLRDLLDDKEEKVRIACAVALGAIGRPARRAEPELKRLMKDNCKEARLEAAIALARIGTVTADSERIVKDALSCDDEKFRSLAGFCVRDTGLMFMPTLLSCLGEENSNARHGAINALRNLGCKIGNADPGIPREATLALVAALKDKDCEIVANAAGALGCIRKYRKDSLPALLALLEHNDYWVRTCAIASIAKFGAEAKSAIPSLRKALQDPAAVVRSQAMDAINEIEAPK
jgi:HEAT repeat protein